MLFQGPSGELAGLLGNEALDQTQPRPYLPGFFVSGDILGLPAIYARRLEMAYDTVLDSGEGGGGLSKFRQFMSRNRLAYGHLNARLYA